MRSDRSGAFAERLMYLVDEVHPPGERPYHRDVLAAALDVSVTYVNKLLRNKQISPSLKIVVRATRHFGVPDSFFTAAANEPVDGDQLDQQIRLRAEPACQMLAATGRLDRPSRQALALIVAKLLQAEKRAPRPAAVDIEVSTIVADATRLSPESFAALSRVIAELGASPASAGSAATSEGEPAVALEVS